MESGAYNIVEKTTAYPPYPTTLSIVEFLRLAWREEAPPAREITVTGLDTLLASMPPDEQGQAARFMRNTLQDASDLMINRRQTVQFVVRGKIEQGEQKIFEVRQPGGAFINLSAIFGGRLYQKANDWLVAPLWI
jgi:hypothetical protein